MKVTYGAIVQRASGRFGGTVHSNWKGVDLVRRFAKPSNPSTTAQNEVRNIFRNATRSYTLQTTNLRLAWVTFATGKPFIARNAFIKYNVPALKGETTLTELIATPGDASTIPLAAATFTPGSGTIDLTCTAPTPPAGWTITRVVLAACPDDDWSDNPLSGGDLQWYETADDTAPYAPQIAGLAAGDYFAAAFIEWQDPQGVGRYSASLSDIVTVT